MGYAEMRVTVLEIGTLRRVDHNSAAVVSSHKSVWSYWGEALCKMMTIPCGKPSCLGANGVS